MWRTTNVKRLIGVGLVLMIIGLAAPWPAAAQAPSLPEGATLTAASPASPATVYAGADRTLYRSDDGGQTWVQAATLPSAISALQPANHWADLVYAGTASAGLYRSFDRGQSWQAINDGLGFAPGAVLEVSALALDPQDDSLVYAATGYWLGTTQLHYTPVAVMASVDSGATWLRLASLPVGSPRVVRLAAVAGQPLAVTATAVDGATARYTASGEELAALLTAAEASPAQQAAAARSLGLLADAGATPSLLAALGSDDVQVAGAAAEALGRSGSPAAVPGLRTRLLAPDSPVPSAAARALAAIGTPEALDALHAALDADAMTPARHAAMAALESLGSPATPGLLALLAGGSPAAQRNAAEMLGWIGDPAAAAGLAAALDAEDAHLRSQAAWALGEIGDPATAPALAALAASDPSADVRMYATQALARMPQQPALAAVPAPQADEAPAVSQAGPAGGAETGRWAVPAWLSALLPALRWLILLGVLAAVALLPWYQSQREERRRRHG